MTPARKIRNVPASVRQRLLNLARDREIRFNVLLRRYAAERFLYRLSVSDEVDRFVLKGAALLRVWDPMEARPTRDVDFLDVQSEDHAPIRTSLEAIRETFRRRGTSFAGERPLARLWSFYEDALRQRLWEELRRGMADDADGPTRLVDAGSELVRFLGPVCDSLIEKRTFAARWPAGDPWRPGSAGRPGGEDVG